MDTDYTYLFVIENLKTGEEYEKRVTTSSESWAWIMVEKYLEKDEDIKSCTTESWG
jgi:hypothetical protein